MANISSLVLFLAIGAVMSCAAAAAQDGAVYSPGPVVPGDDFPPEPQPAYYKYIEECAAKISSQCGNEVYTSVFENGAVTDYCCTLLVEMGRDCHYGLVQTILSLPETKANATTAIPNSLQVWNACVSAALKPSNPSPSPYAT